MYERLKRAVVHLEAATDTESVYDRIRRLQELQQRGLDRPEVLRELAELALVRSRDVRFHGTALFVKHNGRHFLITARHVLHDKIGAMHELEEEVKRLEAAPPSFREAVLASAHERARDRIFGIVYRHWTNFGMGAKT